MLLIVILGPTRFLLSALVENIGLYLHAFVTRTFHVYAYEPTEWVGSWTVFYWGWWISWAPFVGMFIARISRGRTIRQFLLGVLFAPAGFSFRSEERRVGKECVSTVCSRWSAVY